MRSFRFLIAACAGTFLYVFVSIICGSDGFYAENQLRNQKRELSANALKIQKINDELTMETLALQNDKDVIAAYAKKLGYVGTGEKLVKISGLAPNETHIFDPGTVKKYKTIKFLSESVCKSLGFVVFLLVYFIILMYDYSHGKIEMSFNGKHEEVKSIKVYEM